MQAAIGDRIQIVGDDLYVTDPQRIREGGEQQLTNAALIKPNQIGTVSQTLGAIATASHSIGMASMVSTVPARPRTRSSRTSSSDGYRGQIKSGAPPPAGNASRSTTVSPRSPSSTRSCPTD